MHFEFLTLFLSTLLFHVAFGLMELNHYSQELCGREVTYHGFSVTDSNGNTGSPTNIVPWAVQIGFQNGRRYRMRCGGTLITNKHVVTTAHCFRNKFHSSQAENEKMPGQNCQESDRYSDEEILMQTRVTVGAMCTKMSDKHGCVNGKQFGVSMKVKRVHFGDFFKLGCSSGNDIVILELEKVIDGIDGANYACLPFASDVEYPTGLNVTSFGWGADPSQGVREAYFPVIQIINLVPTTFNDCERKWDSKIGADSFCTQEEAKKSMCRGDSGGGLTFEKAAREYLIAIASYGSDCDALLDNLTPKAQINTDIREHQEMIVKFINEN